MNKTALNFEIIDYTDDLREAIKTLNYEWLQRYFRVEDRDMVTLSNPQHEIIDQGGFIYYAKLDDTIVGTVSLIKVTDRIFEVSKMAVTESAKDNGIGKKMLEHCIDIAREKNLEKLILYSNTKLESAIHLYRKYGFEEIALEQGVYERADIKMEKYIK